MVRLSIRVMAHPSRRRQAQQLARSVRATLVLDPKPAGPRSAYRTSMLAWEHKAKGATHLVVLQDDVEVCRNFRAAVRRIVTEEPDAIIAFFTSSTHPGAYWYRTALARCERFSRLPVHHFLPTQALLMPADLADEYTRWARRELPDDYPDDDEAMRLWREEQTKPPRALATVPCLAQHVWSRSLMGHQRHGPRPAACYIGATNPLDLWKER